MQQRYIYENVHKEERPCHLPQLPEVQSIAMKDCILFNLDYQEPEEQQQASGDLPEEDPCFLQLFGLWIQQRPQKGKLPASLLHSFTERYNASKTSPLSLMFDAFIGGLEMAASLLQSE